ncbi:PmoA family protein [Streptomyces chartreusis]|uniref:PmoA family protein n=1 Tax=Streptomyces chartreusis TaxID=1969 RepID=A0A7H8TMZ9_STRCX|nr:MULTISPECIES: PmoA family protein [Streptomyces]MBT1094013.1 PmoA family protein [Streptomyces sp. Tu102]QEV72016.1 oxidoreductase [Streptomyces chartreusis]QKZ24418.1 PmoA family protein [Streptomyces chartreusis]RSO03982.1 oxidoreductase [Streptomyces sp. WAC 05379]GGX21577.1 oxidoreductase [Streptomyces chartreusis]
MSIRVTHAHGDHIAVTAANGTEILRYVYRPDPAAFESRKPYAHPVRTLAGHTVTGYRPSDHRWHKGLQMTASHLSGQNFWGGNCYVHGQGYVALPERVGSMRHDGFPVLAVDDDRLTVAEELTWIENGGEEWAREMRGLIVHSVDEEAGAWALDWSIRLTNTREAPLRFGSPTTEGREMAGYTGLQWRGPRDFTGGTAFAPGSDADADKLMGSQGPWLAFTTEHDDVDGHSTLVFAHAPENLEALHESHWFVRAEPIPTVAFSWAFFEEFELPPGESFAYRYRVVFADGAWDRERVAAHLEGMPW